MVPPLEELNEVGRGNRGGGRDCSVWSHSIFHIPLSFFGFMENVTQEKGDKRQGTRCYEKMKGGDKAVINGR
jgi:hypothetical protein